MTNLEIAKFSAAFADEKKASDVVIIDIAEKSGFADYFVLATAASLRQMSSLASDLEDKLAALNILPKNIEGKGESGWILMDYGDIIINIFSEEARGKYQIEKVWADCSQIELQV